MKTLCIRCILWVFSVLFIQHAAHAQVTSPTQTQTPVPPVSFEQEKQKKPKVKKQWRFAIDIDAGFASPANAELSDVFKGGFNATIGVKTAFLKNKLWIKPLGGLKYYFKKVEPDETHREAFRTWKGGVEIQYKAYSLKKFSFFPIVRVDNNWSVSQFTKIKNEKTSSTTIPTASKVLTGSGISYDGGIMVVHSGGLYVKLDYEYYKPDLQVNPELVQEMLAAGIRIPDHKVYNCSSINLSVGVNLNFKK